MSKDRGNDEQISLDELRGRIDLLDEQIQSLIGERVNLAVKIARSKEAGGSSSYYRPEREAQVLRRVRERNEGPLGDADIVRLMREIMSVSLAAERGLTIAYLGPKGTYANAAATRHFGQAVTTVPMPTIADVFTAVSGDRVDYGIVPVENSTEGFVSYTLDQFLASSLNVCGEVQLRIQQQLLGLADRIEQVERVYSHAQSLAQCRSWLNNNLPEVTLEPVDSNAKAAVMAVEDKASAAIASASAGDLYGLNTLAANIEDQPNNTTRFMVIGKDSVPPSGDDKTSIIVSTRNEVGALHNLLAPLAAHGVSLSRIESRPSGQALWDYVFFMDLVGHAEDVPVARVIEELKENTVNFRLLGSYPAAVL
jgi:chorismate mutase/prephenate dehydratase